MSGLRLIVNSASYATELSLGIRRAEEHDLILAILVEIDEVTLPTERTGN